MTILNKYFLSNYNSASIVNKTNELKDFIQNKTYEEILNFIIQKHGEFNTSTKKILIPEYDQNIEITFDKKKCFLNFYFEKDNYYTLISK